MEYRDISKRYGDLILYEGFDLPVPDGTAVCLLGPSGCGKTTLLHIAAGLITPDSGMVAGAGRISCVFQESRLLPWLSVADNAGYAMDSGIPRHRRQETAFELLEKLELIDASDKLPAEISGGMARRTALARALLAPFDTILLDEPLASLDPDTRYRVLPEIRSRLQGKTVILVTHDYTVASALADRIYRLSSPPVSAGEVEKDALRGILEQITGDS